MKQAALFGSNLLVFFAATDAGDYQVFMQCDPLWNFGDQVV